jgi:putative effector of murein hydrolase LrgA (UPF0299 family)
MLFAVLALFALQYAGDLVASVLPLPIPGAVIGLILLLTGVAIRSRWPGPRQAVPDALHGVTGVLHDHFGLLFVPAGVGVVANIDRLRADGPVLVGVVLLSTATAIAVTAAVMVGARFAGRTKPVAAE